MLANVEDVIKWLELNNLEWWTVSLTKDDNAKVFDSLDDEALEARKQRFRDTMRLSLGNRFVIKAKSNKSSGRGMFQEEFQNNQGSSLQPSQHTVGTIGITPEEVEKRITEALDKANRERELKDLKEQNIQLQKSLKEVDTVGTRIMQKLEPYIGTIASSLVNKLIPDQPAVSIASAEPVEEPEYVYEKNDDETDIDTQNTQDANRIETALIKWANADPDYIGLLEAIADLAASGDNMYTMAKGFIKK
ncbi:MAG: hypothetical protein BGO29_04585 [Bacteroidales bacterium 36-12]|nr:MAG: hypothetical protein BGO29_04585 [Bacteroidales bacterium 36-12]